MQSDFQKLAHQYVCGVAASAPSERLFSVTLTSNARLCGYPCVLKNIAMQGEKMPYFVYFEYLSKSFVANTLTEMKPGSMTLYVQKKHSPHVDIM